MFKHQNVNGLLITSIVTFSNVIWQEAIEFFKTIKPANEQKERK